MLLEVRGEGRVDARAERLHPCNLPLDARLGKDVVVLDPVEQLGQAPEAVGLERFEDGGRQGGDVVVFRVAFCRAQADLVTAD